MLKKLKCYKEHVAVFISFVLTKKSMYNASVRLSFCHTSDYTVKSFISNIAVTVGSHTSHNDEWVKILQKNI